MAKWKSFIKVVRYLKKEIAKWTIDLTIPWYFVEAFSGSFVRQTIGKVVNWIVSKVGGLIETAKSFFAKAGLCI